MQLGIHLGTFAPRPFEEALDRAAAAGLECIHLSFKALGLPAMPDQLDAGLCERILRETSRRDLVVATLSGTFNMIHPDPEVRGSGLRGLRSVAAAAQQLGTLAAGARQLGTPVVALCTGTRDADHMWRPHPDNHSPEAWADLVASMEQALQTADEHEVLLGVEPEIGNVVSSAAKARQLLDQMRSPRLKVIIDPANLFPTGELRRMREVLDTAFDLLGADIVAAHAKDLDHDGEAGRLPAGKGLLDYDHYLGLLVRWGFTGPVILHSLGEADVAGCVGFLREKLGRV